MIFHRYILMYRLLLASASIRTDGVNVKIIALFANAGATIIEGCQTAAVLLGNLFLGRTQIQRRGAVMDLQKRL